MPLLYQLGEMHCMLLHLVISRLGIANESDQSEVVEHQGSQGRVERLFFPMVCSYAHRMLSASCLSCCVRVGNGAMTMKVTCFPLVLQSQQMINRQDWTCPYLDKHFCRGTVNRKTALDGWMQVTA